MLKQNVYTGFSAKITVITLVVLLCMSAFLYADYKGSVITDPQELSFSQIDSFDVVSFEDGYFTDEEGSPQLPVKILKFLIPVDVNVVEVTVNYNEMVDLDGIYDIYPAQPPFLTDGSDMPAFVEQDSTIYNSDSPFPGKFVEVLYDEYSMSYHLVTLIFYPVEYIPSEQILNLYTYIEFTIEYESNPNPIQLPLRQSAIRQKIVEEYIGSSVENPDDFEFVTGGALEIITERTKM